MKMTCLRLLYGDSSCLLRQLYLPSAFPLSCTCHGLITYSYPQIFFFHTNVPLQILPKSLAATGQELNASFSPNLRQCNQPESLTWPFPFTCQDKSRLPALNTVKIRMSCPKHFHCLPRNSQITYVYAGLCLLNYRVPWCETIHSGSMIPLLTGHVTKFCHPLSWLSIKGRDISLTSVP